jgi:hypothetical protein
MEIKEELGICEQHGEQQINMDWDDATNYPTSIMK